MSTAWRVVKRIAYAVVWWLAICLAATPASLLLGLGLSYSLAEYAPFIATVITLPIVVYVWVMALNRRWSAIWPVMLLFVFVWPGCWWIGMIGLGKLFIHAVGRGGTPAGSDLSEPAALDARPRGMVEYANYD